MVGDRGENGGLRCYLPKECDVPSRAVPQGFQHRLRAHKHLGVRPRLRSCKTDGGRGKREKVEEKNIGPLTHGSHMFMDEKE